MMFVLRLLVYLAVSLLSVKAKTEPLSVRLNHASPLQALKESILLQLEFYPHEQFVGGMVEQNEAQYQVAEFSWDGDWVLENQFGCSVRDPNHDFWAPGCQYSDRAFGEHVKAPKSFFGPLQVWQAFESAEVFFKSQVAVQNTQFKNLLVWQLEDRIGFSYQVVSGESKVTSKFSCRPEEKSWACSSEK